MELPSIILILTDHHRWNAWGGAGDPNARTPYLDGVAKLGFSFEQAITSHEEPAHALDTVLRRTASIQAQGYTTALYGSDQFGLNGFDADFDVMGVIDHNPANPAHDVQEIGTQCVRFLQSTPDPFFLCAHFGMSDVDFAKVDHQLGRMLAVLSAHSHTNTTIIYAGLSGSPGFDELPQLDLRIRVPLIISGVRGQNRGATSSEFVHLGDLPPTMQRIAGAEVSQDDAARDLVPILRGESNMMLRAGAHTYMENNRVVVRNDHYILIGDASGNVLSLHRIEDGNVDPESVVGDAKHVRVQVALTKVLSRIVAE